MDTLSRLSHDTDSEVAMVSYLFATHGLGSSYFIDLLCSVGLMFHLILQAAIISLGLIGAGTNNARIAGMLRNLSSYYYKDASLLFCVICYFFCIFVFMQET